MIQSGNINAGEAEESGRKIKIAVIDSGINFSADLPVAVRKNFIPEDERNMLYEDPSGHGTAVAGIIAALDNDEVIAVGSVTAGNRPNPYHPFRRCFRYGEARYPHRARRP